MRIVIITDAWEPQVNGVVRTYQNIIPYLEKSGHEVRVLSPNDFYGFRLFFYKEIKIAVFPYKKLARILDDYKPDAIHLSVEGTLGWAGRKYCLKRNLPFTTTFHTQFPDYAAKRVPSILAPFVRRFFIRKMKQFHSPSKAIFSATQSLDNQLREWGFNNRLVRWVRGVQTDIFYPLNKPSKHDKPHLVYVGRVSVEKNIEAFLDLPLDCKKTVVGGGPDFEKLSKAYPDTHFTGLLQGEALADRYRQADCFVFPSKTDTFGIVMIEALACGLPVAGYNVTGPRDILTDPSLGACDDNLATAVEKALAAPGSRQDRFRYVQTRYSWDMVAKTFADAILDSTETTEVKNAA